MYLGSLLGFFRTDTEFASNRVSLSHCISLCFNYCPMPFPVYTKKAYRMQCIVPFLLRKKGEMEDVTVGESPKSLTASLIALITVKPWESAV